MALRKAEAEIRELRKVVEMFEDEISCRACGCTDDDCYCCVVKTGTPCWWVEEDLCSACAGPTVCPGDQDL